MEKIVKYPIGIQDFEKIVTSGFVYVDKTDILYKLITTGSYVFLSRPRRFGKSLTLSTLKAFFEGKKELFKGLAICELEKDWKKHPVFLLSFARFEKRNEQSMENILEYYLQEWEEKYGLPSRNGDFSNRFATIIRRAVESSGEKAVILIDEYDSALVSTLENQELHEHIKSLLKPVYTVLKDLDSHIQFALITGITRFSRMTLFSGLNNIQDISLDADYSAICGITQQELEKYFPIGIEKLSQYYNLDFNDCITELKAYYDGYHFTDCSPDLYNPFSILNVLHKSRLGNYWFATGIPTYIVERMKHEDIDIEHFMNPKADQSLLTEADSAYTSDTALLFQAGFLTIKNYDLRRRLYTLGIPNREVREGMTRLFMEKFLIKDSNRGKMLIFDMVDYLEAGNPDKFLTLLKGFFAEVPFDMSKGDKEIYFHNAFYIITNLIGLTVQAERHVSAGSIDIVITTSDFVYVIELKLNKTAQEAIDQINSRQYALPWIADGRKVFKIGINFSSETRNIRDWIIQ